MPATIEVNIGTASKVEVREQTVTNYQPYGVAQTMKTYLLVITDANGNTYTAPLSKG